ncbi:MAG: PHP domain-containing protein [Clostridia bacterium]
MKFLSNAHTHTTYCDGKTSIVEMIAAAQRLGFVSLGFSGHADQAFDGAYSMIDGRQEAYFEELRALQALKGTPRLWVGLELDALADEPCRKKAYAQSDYVIGSTHYLCREYAPGLPAVDGDPALLRQYVDERLDGDGIAMARAYYAIHAEMLLRDRPTIIGHFDVVRKHAARHGFFDENGALYRLVALDALERSFPCGGVLEVNTGGMARGYLNMPYPTKELLGAWREMGGETTITSDCHDASRLDYGFDAALRLLASAGYRRVLRLGTGEALWEDMRVAAVRG